VLADNPKAGGSTVAEDNIFVGVDLHKRSSWEVRLSSDGVELGHRRWSSDGEGVGGFAESLDGRHRVVVEPVENSYWFLDLVAGYAGSVHIANPARVRLIAESRLKNDRMDARILADLLRVGYLPEVYIPGEEVQSWLRLISCRVSVVRDRTRLKNRIIGLISREGFILKSSDAFGRRGRRELSELPLSSSLRCLVDSQLAVVDVLTEQLKGLDDQIEAIACGDLITCRLRTIDGLGAFSALAIRAVVDRMERFRSAKAFASYTGLVPSYRQSGEVCHTGCITKQGSRLLRWVLIQAVPHAMRHNEYLKHLYGRLCFRSSVSRARVAVAHALARIIYHVWTEERSYYRT
jgi:transposase